MNDASSAQRPEPPDGRANWLESVLEAISRTTVVVVGDFCLDAYWELESGPEELSLETGLPVHHVRSQRYSPGGAGNVAANAAALGAREVRAVGFVGRDLHGAELRSRLRQAGVRLEGLLDGPASWSTPCYAKPLRDGVELNRFDFGGGNRCGAAELAPLIPAFDAALTGAQGVIINQQLAHSIIGPEFIAVLNDRIRRHPGIAFVVDARNRSQDFRGTILKLNGCEAARLAGGRPSDPTTAPVSIRDDLVQFAHEIRAATQRPVVITAGERGMIVATESGADHIPSVQPTGPVDPVGAGDTVAAALTAALAAGVAPARAARFANLAAAITVQKLQTTGTATPAELRQLGAEPDLIYEPDLADHLRGARRLPGTMIEVIRSPRDLHTIRHAIFDHDGTLSTLRQGWEQVMEPVMIDAVIGSSSTAASKPTMSRIIGDVRAHIDRTTGVHTLAQMTGLIGLVRAHGLVPEEAILDEHGYKARYNERLIAMVAERIGRIQQGAAKVEDFEIKDAKQFLKMLSDAGILLHLVSGTDVADLRAEARLMGFAPYFGDRIHGAVGRVAHDAKRDLIQQLHRTEQAVGRRLLIVGDGPVEMQLGRKCDAYCLGIASNEASGRGLNTAKRRRLIRAGADAVVGDYEELSQLRSLADLGA